MILNKTSEQVNLVKIHAEKKTASYEKDHSKRQHNNHIYRE